MDFYRFLHIIVVIILITCLFSGCKTHIATEQEDGFIKKETATSLHKEGMNADDFIFEDAIRIYKVYYQKFELFLINPKYDVLLESPVTEFSLCQDTSFYNTYSLKQFPINNDLISFLCDTNKVGEYLQQKGVSGNIQQMALIDTPTVPITLWVNVDNNNCFITINPINSNSQYSYEFYTKEEYMDAYGTKIGITEIDGISIETPNPSKIHSDYADLPLLCILENFGAEYKQYSDKFFIKINNKCYILKPDELVLKEILNTKENLLYISDGGFSFIYAGENDVMVDMATLTCILNYMGIKVEITINENVVSITNQTIR